MTQPPPNYWLRRNGARGPILRRADYPPGTNLCLHCPAKCCHYIALHIDTPTTWDDFDTVRWFLLHEHTAVFVDGDTWYLMIYTTCRELRADGLCGIYPTRPKICRDYSTDQCEFEENSVYDQLFEVPQQVEEYAEALLGPRPREASRDASGSLPILPPPLPPDGNGAGSNGRRKRSRSAVPGA
ncbi:YkgJ family cysteine cluster protein [Thermopirellula anaerolimosa]